MAYLRQFYMAHVDLPDGRIAEVRFCVDRTAYSFYAEPEEHYGPPLWVIDEVETNPQEIETLLGTLVMNRTIANAIPIGPALPALAFPTYH